MAITMTTHWPGVTKEQYLATLEAVNWEADPPKGVRFHVASLGDDGFRVTDVWDSAEEFQNFVDTRLMAGTQKAGIQGQPNVIIGEVIRVFHPAYTAK
ncbi:MAG TPA: hypothetical protein VMT90_00130 [Dehalococcoidia bacterium]|jgi:heme-degrading monooxygenase HmoA|nr:hypothetical protein [Dehalococcoidia bacterium]